ncbi:MAG: hypothetical protein ABIU20_08135, partial [Blastocatellia bacterium]
KKSQDEWRVNQYQQKDIYRMLNEMLLARTGLIYVTAQKHIGRTVTRVSKGNSQQQKHVNASQSCQPD